MIFRPSYSRSLSDRIYRALLGFYPQQFRRGFGEDMAQLFRDQCLEMKVGQGWAGLARVWLRTLFDLALQAPLEHFRSKNDRNPQQPKRPSGDSMISKMLQDLRYAFRSLARSPAYTLVAALSLALGIGANSAIFSVVNGVLLDPLPFAEPDRLTLVFSAFPERGALHRNVSPPDLKDWREHNQVFENMGGFPNVDNSGRVLTGEGEPQELSTCYVTEGFFETLGVNPVRGRYLQPENHLEGRNRKVVLSYAFWQSQLGGDPALVGRSLRLSGEPFEVMGIMPRRFQFPDTETEIWVPESIIPESGIPRLRFVRWLYVVARLKPGVTLDQAHQDMLRVTGNLARQYPENKDLTAATIEPLHEILVSNRRTTLLVLFITVGFVLLIACANVANLALSRSEKKLHEIAIRSALGAGRRRIVSQLMTESLLLGVLGGIGGLLIGLAGVRLLADLNPWNITSLAEIGIDLRVLGFTFLISILTGVLFGLAPALRSAFSDVREALQEIGRNAGQAGPGQFYRRFLVAGQVALVTVVAVAAGLTIGSYSQLLQVDPGFDSQNVMTMRINAPSYKYQGEQTKDYFQRLIEAVQGMPQVQHAGIVRPLPLGPRTFMGESWNYVPEGLEEEDPSRLPQAVIRWISPGYFQAMGIPILAGRDYEEKEMDAVVINQSMADLHWSGRSPVGNKLKLLNEWKSVVGVVGNVRQVGFNRESEPTIYVHYQQNLRRGMTLAVRGDAPPQALLQAVQQRIWEVDPDQPITEVLSMQAILRDSFARPRATMVLLGLFAALALLLSAVGIYGTLSYLVQRRTHEIGVRISMGAQVPDILKLVVGQGMILSLVGVALGLAAAVGVTRFMSSLLFEISATEPAVFIVVALVLLAVAAFACYLPGRRASAVDPIQALRYE